MLGIKIENWNGRKGPAQCHRCQQFRHSSHHCHRPQACVRCGEGHAAAQCPRPKEEPPTCANCGGAHTANNTSCPTYRAEAKNTKADTVAKTGKGKSLPPRTEKPQVEESAWPRKLLGHTPHARPFNQGVRFIPHSPEEYRTVQRYLEAASKEDSAIFYYGYSLKNELPTQVFVRAIAAARGRPGCLFHAQLERLSKEELTQLYAVDELLYMPGVNRYRGLARTRRTTAVPPPPRPARYRETTKRNINLPPPTATRQNPAGPAQRSEDDAEERRGRLRNQSSGPNPCRL
ncbi:hypothetical protein JYU34_018294 [Plutella xylostella]|uniref:Nucleic-acid-binding protein from transposon X-element n=1 Tax=Plutella xylostella TaxID=51655 RepID=A0ABQ7Q087_PLUXY|nr:hypothetical protein JYU34_018294 [Plutella xylostella]